MDYPGLCAATLILVLFNMANAAPQQQFRIEQLQQSMSDENVMNPVQVLLQRVPLTSTEQFVQILMQELRGIRLDCEKMSAILESSVNEKLQNVSVYQEYVNEYSELDDAAKVKIQDGFREIFNEIFDYEQEQERKISVSCSTEFETRMRDKMSQAMSYVSNVFERSTSDFITLVTGVIDYKYTLQQALNDCLTNYYPVNSRVNPLSKESSSYQCEEYEIQVLSQFIDEFLVRCATLMTNKTGDDNVINIMSTLPELLPRPLNEDDTPATIQLHPVYVPDNKLESSIILIYEPSPTPSIADHTHHGNHGDSPHDDDHTQHGDRPHPSNHGDHTHHGNHGDHTHHGNHGDHTHHGNHEDHTHHGNHGDRPHHDNHKDDNNQGDHTHITDHTPIQSVPNDKDLSSSNVINHQHSMLILFGSAIVSAILFLLILVIALLIMYMKYCKDVNVDNWNQMNEEKKLSIMKQSGYVNPTYEFFDKVAQ